MIELLEDIMDEMCCQRHLLLYVKLFDEFYQIIYDDNFSRKLSPDHSNST